MLGFSFLAHDPGCCVEKRWRQKGRPAGLGLGHGAGSVQRGAGPERGPPHGPVAGTRDERKVGYLVHAPTRILPPLPSPLGSSVSLLASCCSQGPSTGPLSLTCGDLGAFEGKVPQDLCSSNKQRGGGSGGLCLDMELSRASADVPGSQLGP